MKKITFLWIFSMAVLHSEPADENSLKDAFWQGYQFGNSVSIIKELSREASPITLYALDWKSFPVWEKSKKKVGDFESYPYTEKLMVSDIEAIRELWGVILRSIEEGVKESVDFKDKRTLIYLVDQPDIPKYGILAVLSVGEDEYDLKFTISDQTLRLKFNGSTNSWVTTGASAAFMRDLLND